VTGETTADGGKGEADDATGSTDGATTDSDADLGTGDAGTSDTSGEGTEDTGTSTTTGDDEAGKEPDAAVTKAAEKETEVEVKEEELTVAQQEARLRAQLREQARKTALMEAKLDTLARQRKADHDALEDNEELKDVEPSTIEQHQAKLNEIAQTRGDIISDMLELMLVNPKYADVETVCTKSNLDETIETLAQNEVSKNGGDLVETMMGLEVDIWSQKNPYRYMYSLIKDVHPQFAGKETGTEIKTGDKQDTSGGKKTGKAPAKAPLSAADLSRGGGGKNLGEWTADKIDNLSEMELNKVPADVYEKYLRGDLDK
jgi:hypothetical protein